MKSILIGLTTVFLLAACGTVDVGLPDVTTTAQLAVAYAPDVQVVMLTPGTCEERTYDEQIVQGYQGVNLRVYYGLEPGAYCLTWGDLFSAGWLVRGRLDLTLEAGMAEFVSVVPQIAPEPEPEPEP